MSGKKIQNNNKSKKRPTRIIVLGAGASGLAASRELQHRGYDVLVIEARSRVGGRLKGELLELGTTVKEESTAATTASTTTTTQQLVDLGGALIHGVEGNPIETITSQMGVPIHPISDYCLLLDAHGWPFDPKIDEKMSTFFNECLDATFTKAEEDRDSTQSFGHLFESICQEKSGKTNGEWENPLLKWHRANLELPSGASFYDLGYTWNEDEPYGFDGEHAAVETSWKFVMDNLADGLDILYNSPVTQIRVVLPDGTIPNEIQETTINYSSEEIEEVNETTEVVDEKQISSDEATKESSPVEELESTPSIPEEQVDPNAVQVQVKPKIRATPKKKPAKPIASSSSERTRFSRRIRGDDVNVRRSSRATKGLGINMLQIGHDTSVSYDDPTQKYTRQKRPKRKRNVGDNDSEEEEVETEPSSTVQVALQNGTVLEADAMICTVPLGILKIPENQAGHIKFVPPLSERKQNAIQKLGCGLLNKCAISFSHVFWQDSDFLGLAGVEHSYLVLNAMKYTQKPILIFMFGGAFAKDVEDWTDTEIVEDCLDVLKKICSRDIPDPVDYCVTRWGKEQYSRMAFTYIPPGVDGPKELKVMSEAIYDPILPEKPLVMFAGEHTTPYHPSTMHGAFLSGIREAYRYDVYAEPELNNYLEFRATEEIYQHTFPTKRVYKSPPKISKSNGNTSSETAAKAAARSTPPPPERRSRRRGFGGMTLRKRPKTISQVTPTSAAKNRKPAPTPVATASSSAAANKNTPESASRRSQRSLASAKRPLAGLSTQTADGNAVDGAIQPEQREIELKERQDLLEDRTLLRALDSYGQDCTFIRSNIIPVYGSTRKRNANQIRTRWQQLVSGKKPTADDVDWVSWQAQTVAVEEDNNDNKELDTSNAPTTTESSSTYRTRRRQSNGSV